MATAIITLFFNEDDSVNFTLGFDPPLDNRDGAEHTTAQYEAARLLQYALSRAQNAEQLDDDEFADDLQPEDFDEED